MAAMMMVALRLLLVKRIIRHSIVMKRVFYAFIACFFLFIVYHGDNGGDDGASCDHDDSAGAFPSPSSDPKL